MSSGYLEKIIAVKKLEVAELQRSISSTAYTDMLSIAPPVRPFLSAIRQRLEKGSPAFIAEIKKASQNFNPESIARSYAIGGATCLSVLTDSQFFQGSLADLCAARRVSGLPVLRKDFVIDRYQLLESRAGGADCVLLIVAALPKTLLFELEAEAVSLGMSVLVEVHTHEEMDTALEMNTELIGINNRNLMSFDTDIRTSIDLRRLVPRGRIVVAESGIKEPGDIVSLVEAGINVFLVGEAFMRADDPGGELLRFSQISHAKKN